MGYTHYYYRPAELDAKKFRDFSDDVAFMAARLPEHSLSAGGFYSDHPLVICGWDGKGDPTFDGDEVRFNGNGPDMDHETFAIERVYEPRDWESPEHRLYFSFCKTARKPYDLLVTAALIAFKHRFGDEVRVSSDGDDDEWREGVALCRQHLGYGSLPWAGEEVSS